MAPSRTGQVWSGWAGVCGGRVCWRGRGGGYVRGNGVEGALSEGERWPWLWRSAFGRRWKRGRPFPRAARSFHQPPQLAGSAAAPPAPTELTLFTLNLTGKVSLVSVKKGRLRTKSAIFDSSLGQKGETTNTQTSVGKQNGLVLFTEIILNHRPSGIRGSYVNSPHLKQPTFHVRGRFSGRSPLPTGDYPHQRSFSRTVVFQNRGPSTPEAVFPDGRLLKYINLPGFLYIFVQKID